MPSEVRSAAEALAGIRPGASIVVSGCSGVPSVLLKALSDDSERFRGVTIYSGLMCGPSSYDFLAPKHEGRIRHVSWHMPHAFMRGIAAPHVEFLPISWARIDRFLEDLKPDVALVQLSPARAGKYNLGVSVGYHPSAIRTARVVIAEVNDRMPWTFGNSDVDESDVDLILPVSYPLAPFDQPTTLDPVLAQVGDIVAGLIPNGAILQIGVGGIPSATLTSLNRSGRQVSVYSLVTDELVDLAVSGGLCPIGESGPSIVACESLGTQKTWDFLAENPDVHMVPSTQMQNAALLSRLQCFYSLNSTLEIDLLGQCNSEQLAGRQISGIGGSVDFMEGSWLSPGGRNIVALASATRDGRSRIVSTLAAGTPVTLPRHAVHTVVTEFGSAVLFNKSDRQRRDALIAIAHPDHRAALQAG